MSKHLVIVESPAKCKKIEGYLGKELYKCIASFGHIRQLMTEKGLNCIETDNNYNPLFKIASGKHSQVRKLREEIGHANEIYLATDDDREGEAIAWHICQVFKLPVSTTKRIIFHEITKTALQRAVANPTVIDMNKVNSQKARQVLDLLVGFTISPILWKHISSYTQSSLSAGRCQTPALRLVYDNQKKIDETPGKECYDVTGYFFGKKKIAYKLTKTLENKEKTEEFLNDSFGHKHLLTNEPEYKTIQKSPTPFTTSALQQKANNILHYSPKDTMRICQNLYEAGYITYMRTDSTVYSKEFLESADKLIREKYGDEYIKSDLMSLSQRQGDTDDSKKSNKSTKKSKSKTKKDNKDDNNAQEAHEAIRPTNLSTLEVQFDTSGSKNSKLTKKEYRMYNLIWCHTVESCMKHATHQKFNSIICSPLSKTSYKRIFDSIVFPGWLIVQGYDEKEEHYDYILTHKRDGSKKPVKYSSIYAAYILKDLKTHYTEAKLVSLLEKKGIGRPSTFSSIISKIQERGYVQKENIEGKMLECIHLELKDETITETKEKKKFGGEKNKLVIQPIGKIVIEFLMKHFEKVFDYNYTKTMENELDTIAKGKKIWYALCDECNKTLTEVKAHLKTEEAKMEYKIDEVYTYKIARYGPIIIKHNEDKKKKEIFKVKDGITLEMIQNGEYNKIEEIIVEKKNNNLGQLNGEDVVLKKGKFGEYLSIGSQNISLKGIPEDIDIEKLTIEDVKRIVEEKKKSSGVVREINDVFSLRKSKHGLYVFYKTKSMTKPKFINLKKFEDDPETCPIEMLTQWCQSQV
jgi:DNA topoisomerase-1